MFRDGALGVREVAEPKPAEGQVVVKTRVCGVCASDLHFTHHAGEVASAFNRIGSPFPIDLSRDIVMGHEFCGEVMERGSGPEALAAGTLVCSTPFTITGARAQLVGYCADQPGGYGQYMALNEALLVPVPNGLSAEHAAMTEQMAVGWHAVQRGKVGPEDVALVIGCGPIGLAVVAALKVKGVHAIVAADFNAHRRGVAKAMGADVVIDPAAAFPYAGWAELALPKGYDPESVEAIFKLGEQPRPSVIFECVGVPGMVQRAFEGALGGSRIVVVGVCMTTDTYEPLFPLHKEVDVHFAFFYDAAGFGQSLRHIAEGQIDLLPILSSRPQRSGEPGPSSSSVLGPG